MKKIIQLLVIIFVLQGCTLEAKFGLPISTKKYRKLIGTYSAENEPAKITIEYLKNYHYSLKVYKDKDSYEELRFYISKVNNHRILNLYSTEDKERRYIFYSFKFKKNKLYFSEVTNKLRNRDFISEKDLLHFFKKNIESDNFFHSEEHLTKVKSS